MSSVSNVGTSNSLNSAASSSSTSDPATTPSSGKQVHDLKDLDINQFLQLMVSELTHQDPLNPMDNTQLVQQIGELRSIAAQDQLTSTLQVAADAAKPDHRQQPHRQKGHGLIDR